MSANDYTIDITAENAQQILIDESFKRLIVADFWAAWCAPCKQLMPVLDKLANEYQGQFLLAKIDTDEQQMLAQQLNIRSLPTVMLFKDGQPVDGFTGAQTESFVREMLSKYLGVDWQAQLQDVIALIDNHQLDEAATQLRSLWAESHNEPTVGLYLAHCCILQSRFAEAEDVLGQIPEIAQDDFYQQLVAQINEQKNKAKSPELEQLLQQAASSEDLALYLEAARLCWQEHFAEQALALLLKILKKDKHFAGGDARAQMLAIFKELGNKDPLVVNYQRQLFALLY